METVQKKVRLSNIEALRIFSIFLVIMHHVAIHTNWTTGTSEMFIFSKYFLILGGKVGVDLFVLISGYLMITSTAKFKSLARTISETIVFSVFMYLIVVLFNINNVNFDILMFIKRMFPVMFHQYWFVTSFVLMYITLPIYLPFLKSLSQDGYRKFLFVSFMVVTIWPLIFLKPGMSFSYPVLFLFLFAVGGYIKKFDIKVSVPLALLKSAGFAIAAVGATLILKAILMGSRESIWYQIATMIGWTRQTFKGNFFLWFDASPFAFLVALYLFLAVMSAKQFSSKTVNFIGMHVFGAYLFQSAPLFSPWIYKTAIDLNRVSGTLPRLAMAVVVAVSLTAIGVLLHVVLGKVTTLLAPRVEWALRKFTGIQPNDKIFETKN